MKQILYQSCCCYFAAKEYLSSPAFTIIFRSNFFSPLHRCGPEKNSIRQTTTNVLPIHLVVKSLALVLATFGQIIFLFQRGTCESSVSEEELATCDNQPIFVVTLPFV